eukprot:5331219-Amphidinium_carterae.2
MQHIVLSRFLRIAHHLPIQSGFRASCLSGGPHLRRPSRACSTTFATPPNFSLSELTQSEGVAMDTAGAALNPRGSSPNVLRAMRVSPFKAVIFDFQVVRTLANNDASCRPPSATRTAPTDGSGPSLLSTSAWSFWLGEPISGTQKMLGFNSTFPIFFFPWLGVVAMSLEAPLLDSLPPVDLGANFV